MASWYDDTAGLPTKNPLGGDLNAEQVQLKRRDGGGVDVMDVFNQTIEYAKAQPTEAIGYPLVIMAIFMAVHTALSVVMQIALPLAAVLGAAAAQANEIVGTIVMVVMMVGVFAIFFVIMMALSALMMGAINIAALRLIRGQELKLDHVAEVKRFAKPLIVASIILPLGVMLGYMALFVPGIILILGCTLYSLVIVDKNLSGMQGLKGSWEIMVGHKLQLLGLMFLMSALNMVGAMMCGMGMFITMPLTYLAMAVFYNAIAEPGNAYLIEGEGIDDIFM